MKAQKNEVELEEGFRTVMVKRRCPYGKIPVLANTSCAGGKETDE